jgi:hypothetical protein
VSTEKSCDLLLVEDLFDEEAGGGVEAIAECALGYSEGFGSFRPGSP